MQKNRDGRRVNHPPASRTGEAEFTFALAVYDEATKWVGVVPVGIRARSAREAAQKLDELKHKAEWLRTVPALETRDDEDLCGLIVGDSFLMETTTPMTDQTASLNEEVTQ